MTDVPDEVRRWTAKRKAAVVLSIVKGETGVPQLTALLGHVQMEKPCI